MSDFTIESCTVMPGITKKTGQPVYQCRVKSFRTQLVFLFDDRWGSWWSTRTDDVGRQKEPSPECAAACQAAARKMAPTGQVANPFMEAKDNPFITAALKENGNA